MFNYPQQAQQAQQPVYGAPSTYSPFPLETPASTPSLHVSSSYSSSSTNPYSVPVTPNIVVPQASYLEQQSKASTSTLPQQLSYQQQLPSQQQQPQSQQDQQPQIRLASPLRQIKPKMLSCTSYEPKQGKHKTQIQVVLNANFPYTPDPKSGSQDYDAPPASKTLRILFGNLPVPTRVTNINPMKRMDGSEHFEGLTMYADAPDPKKTMFMPPGANGDLEDLMVPVYAQVLDAENNVMETKTIGSFTYIPDMEDISNHAMSAPYDYMSQSRGVYRMGEDQYSNRGSPAVGSTPNSGRRGYSEQPYMNLHTPEFGNYPQQRPEYPSRYGAASSYSAEPQPSPSHGSSYHSPLTAGTAGSQGWSTPGFVPQPYTVRPPQPSPLQHSPHDTPMSATSSPLPGASSQPSLMRTSQLSGGSPYNPYVHQNAKASLMLQQDLNLMAVGWNQEEWQAKRRLVQFWRRQQGAVIHTAFRAISQSEYIPNSIVISCIYREDKNECFVTSVDAIYLLEALVGVRFSVEEKNRIRRNLEGFRPITVSKSKPGAEEFFKLVMSFPNPKPRNIEKDVKVFPWKIFGGALKKIIGKYSASYILPPNGNMAPPMPPTFSRADSPPIEPYTIPAPLMPAPSSESTPVSYPSTFSAGPTLGDRPMLPESGDYYRSQDQSGMPPTPASYQGMSSSSSSSLPTLSHTGSGSIDVQTAVGDHHMTPVDKDSRYLPNVADPRSGMGNPDYEDDDSPPPLGSGYFRPPGAIQEIQLSKIDDHTKPSDFYSSYAKTQDYGLMTRPSSDGSLHSQFKPTQAIYR